MTGLLVLLSGSELAVDLFRLGMPPSRPTSFDINAARHLCNILSRACNQLTGVVFITVAFTVPLTANMYSIKFLEFFIRDRVNAAILALAVLANANNTALNYFLKEDFVPVAFLHAETAVLTAAYLLLLPYLFYIFRFLHPYTLLRRLEEEIRRGLHSACRNPGLVPACRGSVSESLEHLANIAIRSVDRQDRNTAIETVRVLERVGRTYASGKEWLPPSWFEAEAQLFLSFSSKAVEELNAVLALLENGEKK